MNFFSLLIFNAFAYAAMPATVAERTDFIDTKLRDLPVSESAREVFRKSSWWSRQTVASLVTMDPEERRAAGARDQWLGRELSKALNARDLRFDLTGDELLLYVEKGRAPRLSLMSSVDRVTLSAPARRALRALRCRTLGDVRARLLIPILYGSAPLDEAVAKDLRRLRHVTLIEGEHVVTPAEFDFAVRLADARPGQRARRELRARGVRTLADVRALPLAELAARGQLERKMVGQMTSLLRGDCARGLRSSLE